MTTLHIPSDQNDPALLAAKQRILARGIDTIEGLPQSLSPQDQARRERDLRETGVITDVLPGSKV